MNRKNWQLQNRFFNLVNMLREQSGLQPLKMQDVIFQEVWAKFAAYEEPWRAYHNLDHIRHCLREFDRMQAYDPADNPLALEFALYVHDADYDTRAEDNEIRCAKLTVEISNRLQLTESFSNYAQNIVGATDHQLIETDEEWANDARRAQDIDLSVFGQPWCHYLKYENGIRAEYAWVEKKLFREKRAEILNLFLQRKNVFQTKYFRQIYQTQARSNLARAIKRLAK